MLCPVFGSMVIGIYPSTSKTVQARERYFLVVLWPPRSHGITPHEAVNTSQIPWCLFQMSRAPKPRLPEARICEKPLQWPFWNRLTNIGNGVHVCVPRASWESDYDSTSLFSYHVECQPPMLPPVCWKAVVQSLMACLLSRLLRYIYQLGADLSLQQHWAFLGKCNTPSRAFPCLFLPRFRKERRHDIMPLLRPDWS